LYIYFALFKEVINKYCTKQLYDNIDRLKALFFLPILKSAIKS